MRVLFAKIRALLHRDAVSGEIREEMQFHVDMRAADYERGGADRREARQQAARRFGNLAVLQDRGYDVRGAGMIESVIQDIRYGVRLLVKDRGFTFIAILTLALGIGANIAVFSVLETVMVRMLPVERPQDLRELSWIERRDSDWQIAYDGSMRSAPGGDRSATSFAYPVFAQVRDRSTTFSDVFLFDRQDVTVGVGGRDRRLASLLVSGNFFRGLGVRPVAGRPIGPEDDRADSSPVAVLSFRASERLFGGTPAASLGQVVRINGTAAVVVGVVPPNFYGVEPGSPIDVIAPIVPLWPAIDRTHPLDNPRRWAFRVMGRVKPGVDAARVEGETEALVRRALPVDLAGSARPGLRRIVINPGGRGLDNLRRNYADSLYLLAGIMAVVLLIAVANISGLMLTRAAAREREMRVRLALGARRVRVARQVLTESALLAIASGLVGAMLAFAVRDHLLPLLNQDNDPIDIALGTDIWLAAFSVGLSLFAGAVFGMLPAIRAANAGFGTMSKGTVSSGATQSPRLLAGKTLIVIQVALSFVLLVGASLFMRTLSNLRTQPLGFTADRLLLFQMDATTAGYDSDRLLDFYERVLGRVKTIPGVRDVAYSRYGLLGGGATRDTVVSRASGAPSEIGVHVHFVSPQYFETMGIPLAGGRSFAERDRSGQPRVAIVNQALARLIGAPGGIPLGTRLAYEQPDSDVEVVGVAGDARFASLRDVAPPTLYLPFRQYRQHQATFAARTDGDPRDVISQVERVLSEETPDVPVFGLQTQNDQIDASLRQERIFAYVVSSFGALAALLSCIGIYGTLAYAVARRTAEIGLRIALGADRRRVVIGVVGQSLGPLVSGVVLGLIAANMLSSFVESRLFGLSARDLPTFVAAVVALGLSALLAAWLPARRAARIDPATALRADS